MHISRSIIITVCRDIMMFVDFLGQQAEKTSVHKENQFRQELFALLKKIVSNLVGFQSIIETKKEQDDILKTPLALCIRGIIADFSIGVYFYTLFEKDKILYHSASDLFSRRCAIYFHALQKLFLQDFNNKTGDELESEMEKWVIDFKNKFPSFFISSNSTWDLKGRNHYLPSIVETDEGIIKMIANSSMIKNDHFQYTFYLYKYFSQYQHYSSLSVALINRPFQLDLDYYYVTLLDLIASLEYFIVSLFGDDQDINKRYNDLYLRSTIFD